MSVAVNLYAQKSPLAKIISINLKRNTIANSIEQLQQISKVSIAYDSSIMPEQRIRPQRFKDQRLEAILSYILSGTNLSYKLVANSIVIKIKASLLYTLHGFLYDGQTGENLIGAKIQIGGITQLTNQYGYFSVSLPANSYSVKYSEMGYLSNFEGLNLKKDEYKNVALQKTSITLQDVSIRGQPVLSDSLDIIKSFRSLPLKMLQKLPLFGGEIDLIKALQFQPGVKNPSEGSSGLSVRGGGLDQNLILVDEAPVYNPSHLFGLISIFNSDAIKSVDFYSDYIPANFGGRLASVIDTKLDEGDLVSYHLKGGVSLLSGRLTAEGPIVKNKSSFLISARRSLTDIYNSGFSFFNVNARYYDLNFKSNYIIDRYNRVYFSLYHGFDHLFSQDNFSNDWTNTTSTLRLNHIYSPRLFLNFSAIYSNYRNTLSLGNTENWLTGIRDITFKGDFTFFDKPGNVIQFGAVGTRHHFVPGETLPEDYLTSLDRESALESALYFNQDVNISKLFNLKYGLRIGSFNVSKQRHRESGYGLATQYFHLEPRFQIGFKIKENQILKLTYNRSDQNLQLIQNNEQAYSSLETWLPASKNISPQKSDFVSTSYTWLNDHYCKFSVSAYYRKFYHQADLVDHAQIIQNPAFENQLRFGTGTAYGIEVNFQKKIVGILAEVIYSYSRTFRKIDEINNGIKYPTNYDTPNDLKVSIDLPITSRLSVNALFNYQTGRAISLPIGLYIFTGTSVPVYEGRNTSRFPTFNRLDVSVVLNPKIRDVSRGKRRFESTWRFGIYNLYDRRNPLFYRINNNESDHSIGFEESFSGILPTFAYSFTF